MSWTLEAWRTIDGLEHGFGGRDESNPKDVATLRQEHGRIVHDASEIVPGESGDALVVSNPGMMVGVWTADCVPVLLVSPSSRVAAVAHSGWRGSLAGIVEATLERLARGCGVRPRDLDCALGPTIGGCCYEVGSELRDAFVERHGASAERSFEIRGGRLFLDLRTFLESRLHALGVNRVERVGPCTGCRTDVLYSYRREGPTGRQLSWIGWKR